MCISWIVTQLQFIYYFLKITFKPIDFKDDFSKKNAYVDSCHGPVCSEKALHGLLF